MSHFALIISILIITVLAFAWVEFGKPLMAMLGLQGDERE